MSEHLIDRMNRTNRKYERLFGKEARVTTPKKTRRTHRPTIARLTIHRAGDMTAARRRALGAWLRKQAKHVEFHGIVYATRFSVRYHR